MAVPDCFLPLLTHSSYFPVLVSCGPSVSRHLPTPPLVSFRFFPPHAMRQLYVPLGGLRIRIFIDLISARSLPVVGPSLFILDPQVLSFLHPPLLRGFFCTLDNWSLPTPPGKLVIELALEDSICFFPLHTRISRFSLYPKLTKLRVFLPKLVHCFRFLPLPTLEGLHIFRCYFPFSPEFIRFSRFLSRCFSTNCVGRLPACAYRPKTQDLSALQARSTRSRLCPA